VDEVVDLVGLGQVVRRRAGRFSLGMGQRLGIAAALLGDPELLILDEPANGLDPAGIREIRQLVRRLAGERGIAVFVSSHLLSEIELMCDRVAIIHRGRTLAAAPVAELVDRVASDVVRVRARPARRAAEILADFGPAETEPEGAADVVSARVPPEKVPEALRRLLAAGVDVYSFERPAPSLEEIFLEITGGETV
jgi:ABC-2 type transport system ATP-binding protein